MKTIAAIAGLIMLSLVALSLIAFTTCMCIDMIKSWKKDKSK